MKLFISCAVSPKGPEYGLLAVVAESREEAIERAREHLKAEDPSYVPARHYRDNLLENLDLMMEPVNDGVVVDWASAERRR